ncbi:unnamed protein product, partial [Urochloa humidicola]
GNHELQAEEHNWLEHWQHFLDLTGGVLNFGQMGVQSIDQHTLVNFYGNIGETLLSLETVFFDVLFIIQHYVL